MKLYITLKGLNNLQQEFFVRELNLLEVEYPLELHQSLEKYKKDRGMKTKIVNFLRSKGMGISLDIFLNNLNTITELKLFDYKVIRRNKNVLEVRTELSDTYFDALGIVKSMPMGRTLLKRSEQTKKGFLKRWDKVCQEYKPKSYKIEVIK